MKNIMYHNSGETGIIGAVGGIIGLVTSLFMEIEVISVASRVMEILAVAVNAAVGTLIALTLRWVWHYYIIDKLPKKKKKDDNKKQK